MSADLLFGIDLPPTVTSTVTGDPGEGEGDGPVARARRAEALGFDFLSTSDHPEGTQPTNETWTLLTWIAAHTTRIRLATRVLGVPYRPPAIVAKMAETLHRLSAEGGSGGGRLILGLGGGYSDDEFRAFGLPVPSPREKVDGMADAIRIARGLWTEPSFSYAGPRYHTRSADLEPKPVQAIPIWLGTYGNRALEVTGRLADGWIPSLGFAAPEAIPPMRDRVLAAARSAGRDPAALTAIYNLGVRVDERAEAGPSTVAGAPDAVAERLLGFVRLGFTGFNFQPVGPDRAEQVERLAVEVIPLVRAGR